MASIPGSVTVTGFIAPTDTTDTYAVTDPVYGIDGLRSVADHTSMNAITNARRRVGMVVYTQNDGIYWSLLPSPWTGTDSDWTQLVVAGNQGYQGIQGCQGYQGVQGYQGSIGYQGVQGYQGSIGYQGVQGIQGSQGYQGSIGYQGLAQNTIVFILGGGSSCTVGTDLTNHVVAVSNGSIAKAYIVAKTAPVGSALVVDILKNGTSIWSVNTSNRLQLASGSTYALQTNFDDVAVTAGDIFTIDVVQVGSTTPGKNVTVQLLLGVSSVPPVQGNQGYQGSQGQQGYQGEPGVTPTTYVFTQTTATTIWNISHGMNKYPSIIAFDGSTEIFGDISYIDTNNVSITFSQSVSGTAYLN